MQQADHSFAALHRPQLLILRSISASWVGTKAQGRAQSQPPGWIRGPTPGSVQSPAQRNPYFPNGEGKVWQINIARQKITIPWEVLKFPHFFLFHRRNVTVCFLHPRWLTKQLRITELPWGHFLDCHQIPEHCHVRLPVTLDPWLLNASVRLISHLCLLRLLTKGTQCHFICMVNTSGPVKWYF